MRTSPALTLLATSLVACGTDPPTPSEVRARVASDLGNVLHETKTAYDASTVNLPQPPSALIGGALDSTGTAARVAEVLRIPRASRTVALDAPADGSFDPDAAIKWLNDNLFTDANYLGDGIYKVPPELVCTTETVAPDGTITDTIDPDCASRLALAQLRVRVEDSGNGTLRFAIQLDPDHDEPLAFLLRHDEVAVSLVLDDAGRAMISLAQLFGEQAPNASLSGQATADLQILGSAHARASLSFDRAISVKVADQGADLDGPAAVRFSSAAAQVVAIELDGGASVARLDLGLGATALHLAGDTTTKDVDLALPGATMNAVFTNDRLAIDHLSLGTAQTVVRYAGAVGATIDLNPNDARSLSATLTADPATGIATIAVSPRLDLQTTTDHAVIGDTPPVYDVTRVQLDGTLRGSGASNSIEVATGAFSIATNPAQYGFVASAGQCVTSTDAYDATTGAAYTQYAVGACP